MSNHQKQQAEEIASVLFTGSQKPLVDLNEKKPKLGNGKTTFKTASAAANAARSCRDAAGEAAKKAEEAAVKSADHASAACVFRRDAENYYLMMQRVIQRLAAITSAHTKRMLRSTFIWYSVLAAAIILARLFS